MAEPQRNISKIAVFCGSSCGLKPVFMESARSLGEVMASRGIGLVYGGGSVGLMGEVSSTVARLHPQGLAAVLGVIPEALQDREVSGVSVGETRVVANMHLRKAEMAENADGFIALPGGFGTLEEITEVTTWLQLGFHAKPVGLLNVDGFYDKLLEFLDHCTETGFIRPQTRAILLSDSDPRRLIDKMLAFTPPPSVIELAKNGLLDIRTRG